MTQGTRRSARDARGGEASEATRVIATSGAPTAIGPYAQGIRAGDLVFTSGQIGLDPATKALVPGGVGPETRQALRNLSAILGAAGATMADVVKVTVFLADLDEFGAMNEAYASALSACTPARATVGVDALPLGARVEIDMVARLPR